MAKISSFSDYAKGRGDAMGDYHIATLLYDAIKYNPYVSDTAKNQSQKLQEALQNCNDPSYLPNKIMDLQNYIRSAEEVKRQISSSELNSEYTKVLIKNPSERRAGFINASILLYAIMNIAIIIAITVFLL